MSGLHRVDRGAEIAFMSIAEELARSGDSVTLIGSGPPRPDRSYLYRSVAAIARERFERFPKFPLLRDETAWEDASFAASLLTAYDPDQFDVTLTCAYPFTNWALRRPQLRRRRPPHVFVTQNGDWPAFARASEYRLFGCEGLVCINPDYQQRNADRFRTALIPNGVDLIRFTPGPPVPARFGLDPSRPVILMVSALIASKNVAQGIESVSRIAGAQLLVAGDGPLRGELQQLADERMPGRYFRISVSPEHMPDLYRSANAFLHLSRDESFGNVFLEAMACDTPTVAFDLPRTRWILGETGYLVKGATSENIAEALGRALAEGGGSDQRPARAAGFSWREVATRYRAFLADVVAAPR